MSSYKTQRIVDTEHSQYFFEVVDNTVHVKQKNNKDGTTKTLHIFRKATAESFADALQATAWDIEDD